MIKDMKAVIENHDEVADVAAALGEALLDDRMQGLIK